MAANGKRVIDAGGVIIEVMANTAFQPSTRADLDAWISAYSLPVTTVRDPDSLPNQTLTALMRREYTYVIDFETMKILDVYIGSTNGSGVPSVIPASSEVLARLGQPADF